MVNLLSTYSHVIIYPRITKYGFQDTLCQQHFGLFEGERLVHRELDRREVHLRIPQSPGRRNRQQKVLGLWRYRWQAGSKDFYNFFSILLFLPGVCLFSWTHWKTLFTQNMPNRILVYLEGLSIGEIEFLLVTASACESGLTHLSGPKHQDIWHLLAKIGANQCSQDLVKLMPYIPHFVGFDSQSLSPFCLF